jgi:peptidoglycan biosynthesis protein MviN/MurJ (putative lipid II flippase)
MVAMAGMIMNVGLNLILIPKMQAKGAAISGMVTQYITAGLQIWLAHRVFKFKFQWTLGLRYLIFISLCFSLFYLLHGFNGSWIIRSAIGTVACLMISLLLFLIRPRELLTIFKTG